MNFQVRDRSEPVLRALAVRVALVVAALAGTGCEAHMLVHAGYAAPNKVWYHWQHGADKQTIVVCDVQPDGSETNCRESDI